MRNTKTALLLTSALCSALYAGSALAADAPAADAAASSATQLTDVVVTATRQSESANRISLAITAATQKTLDQKGIKSVTGLVNEVPGLTLTQVAPGVANVAIRGITQASQGAATTGFYLDDTPIQKRNVSGGVATGNGTPIPALYDLERVEVLRGPQGTLYGGSSEGGTVRYITPTPSLTTYSSSARAEVSQVQSGDPSGTLAFAVGGPIIPDKLAARGSFYYQHVGGYIDYVRLRPGSEIQEWDKNADSGSVKVFRGTVLWAPTDKSKLTLSYLGSADRRDNQNTGSYALPTKYTLTFPTTCYNSNLTPYRKNPNVAPSLANYYSNGKLTGTYTGIYYGYTQAATGGAVPADSPSNFVPVSTLPIGAQDSANGLVPVARGAACNGLVGITHTTVGGSFGPYNLKKFQSVQVQGSPTSSVNTVVALTFDYEFENGVTAKVISSYLDDETKTYGGENSQLSRTYLLGDYNGIVIPQDSNSLFSDFPDLYQNGHFVAKNKRYGMSEEIRFASSASARPFSWVAGVFYSNSHEHAGYFNSYDLAGIADYLYGITPLQRYGVPAVTNDQGQAIVYDAKNQDLHDQEIAAFFEGNYYLLDNLKLTAGIRFSRTEFDFIQSFFGPVTGNATPTFANGGINAGSVTETPTTPKLTVTYNFTPANLVYATAAKGTRPGGINSNVGNSQCKAGLDQIAQTAGLASFTSFDLPTVYKGDSVWSYEIGGKFRVLDNRVQMNVAAYHIDWKDAQFFQAPPGCGLGVNYNLTNGGIVSEGIEIESQASLFAGLVANISYGFNNSYYAGTNYIPNATTGKLTSQALVLQGQRVQAPPYRISAGLGYNFDMLGMPTFARFDTNYTAFVGPTPYGVNGWTPDASGTPPRLISNVRFGTTFKAIDANVFVNNVFNATKGSTSGGRTGCVLPTVSDPNADCHNFTGYGVFRTVSAPRPIEFGIQLTYKH